MQTFLPLDGYAASARVLDNRRLGKQRVECKQILRSLGVVLDGKPSITGGWRYHPAVRMWKGYEYSLCCYAIAICSEWIERGYRDSLLPQFCACGEMFYHPMRTRRPPFMGLDKFHASHRSNLLRKNLSHYGMFGWAEPNNLPYSWPSSEVSDAVS